jgi:heme A synthase
MTMPTQRTTAAPATASQAGMTPYRVLVGLVALGIVLQGVWAGMFIRPGQANSATWVTVHARGAEVTLVLALAATVVAFLRLRARRDLFLGAGALVVLLALQAFIGGLVYKNPGLTAVHIPLAIALMALPVWLLLRSLRGTPAGRT